MNPGAFVTGGFIAGAVNNTNFTNDRILQTAWVGAQYSITPALDITGAYYHEWQNSFATGANAGCTDARASQCSGSLDTVSLVVDWRFARHIDMYAGVIWSQVQNGLANGFLQANGTPAGGINRGGQQQGLFVRSRHWSALPVLIQRARHEGTEASDTDVSPT